MPLLRFDILEGRTDEEIGQILDAAHAAQVEAFGVPDSDRFQVVHEHKPSRVRFGDIGLGIKRSDKEYCCRLPRCLAQANKRRPSIVCSSNASTPPAASPLRT